MPTVLTIPTFDRCTTNACPHCAAGRPTPPDLVADGSTDSLWELDEDVRATLPPHFHQPYFDGLGRPHAWICIACWGDGWVAQWPCHVAQAHGAAVAKALGVGASS